MFSQTISEFWAATFAGDPVGGADTFSVVINPDLGDDRRVSVLNTMDGTVKAAVTTEVADRLGLRQKQGLSEKVFRQLLTDAAITLHGADCLFYFTESATDALLRQPAEDGVRRLTEQDSAIFAKFQSSASDQDLDDAYVELDHWAVFGSFEQDRLVSAASMYPWGGAPVADLGVLTLPEFRGRGHARKVVRTCGRHAHDQGHALQYRCQLDNSASRAAATSAGLALFGQWEVVSPDPA